MNCRLVLVGCFCVVYFLLRHQIRNSWRSFLPSIFCCVVPLLSVSSVNLEVVYECGISYSLALLYNVKLLRFLFPNAIKSSIESVTNDVFCKLLSWLSRRLITKYFLNADTWLSFFPGAGFSLIDFCREVPLSSVYCLILDFKYYL